MKRYIGIDLHTNSFTICILQESSETIKTYKLQGDDLNKFIAYLSREDEVAVEATGNSSFFVNKIKGLVSNVVVIAPWQFHVIRKSVKKTDKHDARAIAFFLCKGMLPESNIRDEKNSQIISLIATRDKLVKTKTLLINKTHSLFVRNGLKVKKENLTTVVGFQRAINDFQWSEIEKIELDVIFNQLQSLRENIKILEKSIIESAKNMNGYKNILSIKAPR